MQKGVFAVRSRRYGRRAVCAAATALPLSLLARGWATARAAVTADTEPFDWDRLVARARELAEQDYRPPHEIHPEAVGCLDYDGFHAIRFRDTDSLWAGTQTPVQFFTLGQYYRRPVAMHVLRDGLAMPIDFRPELFDWPDCFDPGSNRPYLGFTGFRVMATTLATDWLSFVGASYFRAAGDRDQYGMSARGLAVNTAVGGPEEFPDFRAFWLEREPERGVAVRIYALLDGPSVTGAYRFDVAKPRGVEMTVATELFFRRPVERLGIGPLTSMYWYGENNRRRGRDWRPEIHDSDGLAIWTGHGERIWRPLANPPRLMVNAFVDDGPRGFGLLQRDRSFANYQDDGVFYERRPSVWVEPLTNWGQGSVQLVEIPTDDEIYDNIVAFWVPAQRAAAGDRMSLSYRLFWASDPPFGPQALYRVTATRIGRGGRPGQERPDGVTKFVVDFQAGPQVDTASVLPAAISMTVEASRGEVVDRYAQPIAETIGRYRAVFDLAAAGGEPVDLRLWLGRRDARLSETWVYQWFPEVVG